MAWVPLEQRQKRRGEQPVLVDVAPIVLQPPVEGPQIGVGLLHVVDHVLLHRHSEGGEQDGPLHALGIKQVKAGVGLLVGGKHVLGGVGVAPAQVGVVALGPEHLVHGARRVGLVELHVHEVVGPVAHFDFPLPIGPLAGSNGHFRVTRLDVAAEAVGGLVVVVVGVERAVAEGGHGVQLRAIRMMSSPTVTGLRVLSPTAAWPSERPGPPAAPPPALSLPSRHSSRSLCFG